MLGEIRLRANMQLDGRLLLSNIWMCGSLIVSACGGALIISVPMLFLAIVYFILYKIY